MNALIELSLSVAHQSTLQSSLCTFFCYLLWFHSTKLFWSNLKPQQLVGISCGHIAELGGVKMNKNDPWRGRVKNKWFLWASLWIFLKFSCLFEPFSFLLFHYLSICILIITSMPLYLNATNLCMSASKLNYLLLIYVFSFLHLLADHLLYLVPYLMNWWSPPQIQLVLFVLMFSQ